MREGGEMIVKNSRIPCVIVKATVTIRQMFLGKITLFSAKCSHFVDVNP